MSFWITQGEEIRVCRAEKLVDGRKRLTRFWSWRQNSETQAQLQYNYGDLDPFSTKPTGWDTLRLAKVEADSSPANNGAGNDPVIQLTYEEPGTVKQVDETRNNGGLLLRTITSFYDVPATPIGYTLVTVSNDNVSGFPYKVYQYAKGAGEVSRAIDYGQSSDQGTTGVTRTTIRYLVVPGATVQPTSLSGSVEIARNMEEGDGYRIWTTTWGKGTGTIVDEAQTISAGALIVYHRVALGAVPSTPSATIGGTVTLFNDSSRNDSGYVIYDRRWAEGDGQNSITTEGHSDGAIDYAVTTFTAAAATPAYPGGGTAYLIRLTQEAENAYSRNVAVYRKPPATVAYRKTMGYQMPGLAYLSGTQLILSPPVNMQILATVTVSYSTTQTTTAPWTITAPASFYDSYVPYLNPGTSPTGGVAPTDTSTAAPQASQRGLGGYVAGSSSSSGTNNFYSGSFCQTYAYTLVNSTPSARPSGATTISVDNDDYLTDTSGTKLFRVTVVTYSF